MTISSGGLIQASDYNTLRTTVSNILGTTGSGDVGYGQAITADTPVVSNTDLVSATTTTTKQWVALYNDMLKIAQHQGTDISTLTTTYANNIKSGSVIYYNDIRLLSDTVTTLYNNRLNLNSSNTYWVESQILSSQRTTQWGALSKPSVQHSFTLDFTTYTAARYFFNTGGRIMFTASRTGGTTPWTQNDDWTAMLSSIGTVVFNYGSTSASSGNGTSIGFYQLTGVAQQIYTKGGNAATGGATYALNDYTITASISNAVITFNVYFNDDDNNKTLYDFVDGTLTSTIQTRRASVVNGVTVSNPSATTTTPLTT